MSAPAMDHDADDTTHAIEQPARPHSFSLDLEHHLDELDEPATASTSATAGPASPTRARPQSIDTTVLISIVTQLREENARLIRERDDLMALVADATARDADLNDALQHMTEKFTAAQEEIAAASELHKEDQEAITMLRAKVEESRRGLMRLQTESRRSSVHSTMTLDLSRAGIPNLSGPPTGKRAPFTPLTGSNTARAHRRISSITEPGSSLLSGFDLKSPPLMTPGSPRESAFGFVERDHEDNIMASPPSKKSKRMSGFFGRVSPPIAESVLAPEQETVEPPEVARLRRELKALQDQLEETRHELSESTEAKDASEMCAKALREFIAEHRVGEISSDEAPQLPLPNVPQAAAGSGAGNKKQGAAGGWGFKLWRSDSMATTTSTSSAGSMGPPAAPTPKEAPPPAAKFGLFGQRNSHMSAASSSKSDNDHGSDESSTEDSIAEPISPWIESSAPVMVRAASALSADMGDSVPEAVKVVDVGGGHVAISMSPS